MATRSTLLLHDISFRESTLILYITTWIKSNSEYLSVQIPSLRRPKLLAQELVNAAHHRHPKKSWLRSTINNKLINLNTCIHILYFLVWDLGCYNTQVPKRSKLYNTCMAQTLLLLKYFYLWEITIIRYCLKGK